jgi:hypothetical protein
MPADLIYASAVLCEKVLMEDDGIASAIRMVDVVFVKLDPSVAPELRPPVMLTLLAAMRFEPLVFEDHSFEVDLIRPDGEKVQLLERQLVKAQPSKFPGAPHGFTARLQFGLVPRNLGTCFITAKLDGEVVARVPLTLLEAPSENPEGQ